jgi:glycine/serine hydroxymethyltransferase
MRFGTAALTSRGITEEMTKELGKIITDCVFDRTPEESQQDQVKTLVSSLNWYY